jgi:hypothetical protein
MFSPYFETTVITTRRGFTRHILLRELLVSLFSTRCSQRGNSPNCRLISFSARYRLSRELKTFTFAAAAAACALAIADFNAAFNVSLDPLRGTEHQNPTLPAEGAKITSHTHKTAHFCSRWDPKFCSMKSAQDIRDAYGQNERESMAEKSREFCESDRAALCLTLLRSGETRSPHPDSGKKCRHPLFSRALIPIVSLEHNSLITFPLISLTQFKNEESSSSKWTT